MNALQNYWVIKYYRVLGSQRWMNFIYGFQSTSLKEALTHAAKKNTNNFKLFEDSPTKLRATDPEYEDTQYTVLRQDQKPDIAESENVSIRDETVKPRADRKPMPVAGALFSPWVQQKLL